MESSCMHLFFKHEAIIKQNPIVSNKLLINPNERVFLSFGFITFNTCLQLC